MSQDLMKYDQMTQLALRGVVRDAIRRVIREDGLPGAHHFYITFLTRYPGVDIDESLAGKYADEITIVLEHQYWDLKAHDETFEVTLKFAGVPKYLSVPYTAITRFHDPSVGFALQFDPPEHMQERPPTLAQIKPQTKDTAPALRPAGNAPAAPKLQPKPKSVKTDPVKAGAKAPPSKSTDKVSDKSDESKVVSLDSFRKK
ncbi:SspB family protein [Robiginitomaculum antarcticum]|uniref:SspB family protein n=1 Tax=Robiginitomaculum antarcticum TaxID=437507 RepID=UPI0003A8FE13|nr:ClpXP protease specificity-enhancing factor SspB [Robiginitomaculum antarcticum]